MSFPATVHTKSSAVTLLRGEAYHLGAKRITLRLDSSKEFQTKQAISLMVEMDTELVDKQTWERSIAKPIDFVQGIVGKNNTLLSSWGTRFWNDAGKLSTPPKCCKITTNISIAPEALAGILRLSGTNVWVSPRQGQEVYHNYRPIWIRGIWRTEDASMIPCYMQQGLSKATGALRSESRMNMSTRPRYPGQPLQPSLNPPKPLHVLDHRQKPPAPINAN